MCTCTNPGCEQRRLSDIGQRVQNLVFPEHGCHDFTRDSYASLFQTDGEALCECGHALVHYLRSFASVDSSSFGLTQDHWPSMEAAFCALMDVGAPLPRAPFAFV